MLVDFEGCCHVSRWTYLQEGRMLMLRGCSHVSWWTYLTEGGTPLKIPFPTDRPFNRSTDPDSPEDEGGAKACRCRRILNILCVVMASACHN